MRPSLPRTVPHLRSDIRWSNVGLGSSVSAYSSLHLPVECLGGLEFAPVRASCGGGTAAWVTGVLAAPGTQGSWQLGQQEI